MARIRPIFKWPGGKYRLLDAILTELPPGVRLVEPFVGSGAVFMNSDYPAYLLCDLNVDLIGFYEALAERGEGLVDECRGAFAGRNSPEDFYECRERFNSLPPGRERAVLFLYLNRHGYNGLIRYNSRGEYNVPFGRYARPYFPEREMLAFIGKTRAARVEFLAGDFRRSFEEIRAGDSVYCDPPYIPLSDTANFTSYAGNSFGAAEQAELARLAERAARGGARVVVSNHDTPVSRELYARAVRVRELSVRRSISCNGDKRGVVGELLAVYL